LLNKINPELANTILFINQGKSNRRDIPMAEVRFLISEWEKRPEWLLLQSSKLERIWGGCT
jgi:hypothetical protein